MSDAAVGIASPLSPTGYVDNEQVTNDDGTPVLRQKIRAPMVEMLLSQLTSILAPLGLARAAGGALRAVLESGSTTAVTGTLTGVTTVTTVTTVTNVAQIGGVAANLYQYNQSAIAAQGLRSRIVVT